MMGLYCRACLQHRTSRHCHCDWSTYRKNFWKKFSEKFRKNSGGFFRPVPGHADAKLPPATIPSKFGESAPLDFDLVPRLEDFGDYVDATDPRYDFQPVEAIFVKRIEQGLQRRELAGPPAGGALRVPPDRTDTRLLDGPQTLIKLLP